MAAGTEGGESLDETVERRQWQDSDRVLRLVADDARTDKLRSRMEQLQENLLKTRKILSRFV
jgi:hypothetical protein